MAYIGQEKAAAQVSMLKHLLPLTLLPTLNPSPNPSSTPNSTPNQVSMLKHP